MKVLIVNTHDLEGGAARAALRLHQSLLSIGMDSQMMVQRKVGDDYTVSGSVSKFDKFIDSLRPTLDSLPVKVYKNHTKTLFSPSIMGFSNLVPRINDARPDIVHLHWICNGMLQIEDIARIKAPLVWSLHDMWAFTGGCHYDENCGKYTAQCGSCPVLGSSTQRDLSRKVWQRKSKIFPQLNLTVVGVSKWLASCAEASSLMRTKRVVNLPNPIDTDIFAPVEKNLARDLLNLPRNKKVVLFGALNAIVDPRKGYAQLLDALRMLPGNSVHLAVFGSSKPQSATSWGFPVHYLGHLHDDISLRVLYSAADVMIVPSLQEAFGQTATEAMACATPVVAFGATGLLDIVDHKENGYLAAPFAPTDLAAGIDWVLNEANYSALCKSARDKVLREFASKVVAKKYEALYNDILQNSCS